MIRLIQFVLQTVEKDSGLFKPAYPFKFLLTTSLITLLFIPKYALSADFSEIPRSVEGYILQIWSGYTDLYEDPNIPCGIAAAGLNNASYEYTNPRGGVKPGVSLGCFYDLVLSGGVNSTGYPDGTVLDDWFGQAWIFQVKGCPEGYSDALSYPDGSPVYSCRRTSDEPTWRQNNQCSAGNGTSNGNSIGSNIVGNPIILSGGIKHQVETDIPASGAFQIGLQRNYRSPIIWGANRLGGPLAGRFGVGWYDSYHRKVVYTNDGQINTPVVATVSRPNGMLVQFALVAGVWEPEEDVDDQLVWLQNASGVTTGWEFTVASTGTVETFDQGGKLQSITYRSGNVLTLSYSDATTPTEVALASRLLIRVEDTTGQFINFIYNSQGHFSSATNQAGQVWGYRYDSLNNLEYVDNPDGTTKQYHYEDINYPNALTGITDERGIRYATFGYDPQGRANLSMHAGNAQRVDITYSDTDKTKIVTNSRGQVSTYNAIAQLGVGLTTDISGPGCTTCGNGNTKYSYDPTNNDLLSKTENDVVTQYGNYDAKGQYGFKIEAVGTPEQRRTDYTYDPRFNNKITTKVETSVATGNSKTTTYTYDNFANRTSVTVDGFRPDGTTVSRTTTYQYTGPLNQLTQINGPRTDVTDITTLDYYANDATQGVNRGRLQSITGPAGIVLRDNILYTATGKVLSEDRPNGISLAYTYYAGNDRLETLTETSGSSDRVTRWTYLATGEVETITQADGTTLATTTRLVYDDARRLVGMIDQLGNHIDYVLDTEGNRIDEKVFDSANVLYKSVQQTFDIYNRLDTRTLVDEIIDYNFQPDGSLDNSINAKNVSTDFQYDALKRLTNTTGDMGGTDADTQDTLTQYVYDAGDRLTSVISPNNANTTYGYDDLGNLLSETSPDRGTRNYTYDEAGNVATITDARSITVNYSYDALNRVTTIDYPGTAEDISMTYDTAAGCSNGVGKLCIVTDNSGTTTYGYDTFGNLAQQDKTELGITYSTTYLYDALNRITTLTPPSGRTVTYGYDALGRTDSIDAVVNNANQTLVHNLQYRPDGQLTNIEFGNGFAETRLYNLKARLTAQAMPTGPANTAPTVATTIPSQIGDEGILFNYTVPASTFVDADAGDTLSYSASLTGGSPLPAWLSFNTATRTFSGTPAASDVGILSVNVTATDTGGLSANTACNVSVNAATATVITGTETNNTLTGGTTADVIYGLGGNDTLNGNNGDDTLNGGAGNDTLNGGLGDDTLIGGPGNDTLNGNKGADTYRFSLGFGQDTLSDYDYTAGVVDRIVFDTSISAADVSFTRIGNKLIITVGTGGDTITSNYWFNNAYYKVEEISFEDGSPMMTVDDVYRATLSFSGTASNDSLYGDYLADVVTALAGNDSVWGYDGDDTLYGGSGADYLYGHGDDDTLIGGPGNDRLMGYQGNDTYRFAMGDGQDILSEYDTSGSTDRIIFDNSVTGTDVSLTRIANGLTITYGIIGDTITSSYWFNNAYYKIEEITFDDGSPMITADDVYRATLTFSGTAANETLYGDYLADVITALAGNDSLWGYNGDDILDGGAGNDYLYGHNDNDTLIGGTGDDRLYGSIGADSYRFNIGDGQDIISEYDTSGSVDKVIFGPGITSTGMSYTQSGNNLIIAYTASDQVTVNGWFINSYYKMEQVVFDDGTVLTPTDIAPLVAVASEPQTTLIAQRPSYQHKVSHFSKVTDNHKVIDNAGTSPFPLNRGEGRGEGNETTNDRPTDRLMLVMSNGPSNSGYQVWQKGPATGNTWMQTATDPNAHDRPKILAYLTEEGVKIWQKQLASNDATQPLPMERVLFDTHYPAVGWAPPTKNANRIRQWINLSEGEYLKTSHGGTAGTLNSDTWTYSYDANGNVDTMTNITGATIYGYDPLDRITNDDQPTQAADTLSYDRNGNRTSITDGTTSINSVYLPNSNQLNTLNSGTIVHDLAGNRTSDQNGSRTFEYNNAGRLFKVYEGGALIATYTYNYQGQRTRKVTATNTTVYHYDQNGSLISETDNLGVSIRDIVYRGTVPVAQIDTNLTAETITYLHTDHLGTPRRGTDENGVVVWSWDSDAFGATAANDDPDGDSVNTVVNLRFAGQYYDQETGLHYNYFRYYDPATGRYITSDPIGLLGGINTYAYVENDPINWFDPFGLARICSRPLEGFGGIMAGPLRHDQILYDNGTDNGFFNDDNRPIRNDDGHDRSEYSCSGPNYDDDAVQRAEEQVQETWDNDWRLFGNNCQDYTDAVIDQLTGQTRRYRQTRRGRRVIR